ncbi:MFS transporter [Bacillus sp. 31A1R]|uniref:MFS transporter n=1 Tax=Robertmurraya mangrovi TaxID=3098077 RepID=A0ABU5IW69_9BACI|nr:MFS transporter [Bacillus sp. 31A1R]MDZ5471386.1 MFS transporter [Bacillus sp. 31A1R]
MSNHIQYSELRKHKDFIFVLLSSTLSSFGFVLFQVVLLWLAYKMSSNTFEAAIVVQSTALPYLLFGLVGGVYADCLNRKKIFIFNQLGTAIMILMILIMFLLKWESIYLLAGASFFIVTFRCFYSPAIRSMISVTLPEPLWPIGNSIFQLSLQLSRSLAPIASSFLITHVAPPWMFGIFLLLTILPLMFILPIKIKQETRKEPIKVLQELQGTFNFLKTKKPLLLSITSFGIVLIFFTGMERLGLPIISDQELELGAKGFSVILTLFGVGSALGAVWLGKWSMKSSYSIYILIGCIVWGLGLMGVGLSPNIYIAGVFAFLTGVAEAFIDLPMILMIQTSTPDDKIGKVFSVLSTVAFLGEAGSMFLVALFIEQLGIQISFIVTTILIFVVCTFTLFYLVSYSRNNRTNQENLQADF